ncbi:hypothetical protein PCANC_04780 [Puccinia coronata f. sp. avenae]|uniref:Uncharacterized protein n=1 Tax=Puccinia coronata f. sp. avenae TaxID=200324 RepID=A0A2N5SCI9_9BASI|nr:hypothetical protein PCANC_17413 [Puccinia coronata f. sp. avenae]PLW18728.1 hypothetical protein PCASD_15389 [Puccinia coronata f. sp. avenae]PLW50008.1 hypothetical protein PCASD_01358 [Puccinia coronata f. sp. avenae]PLW54432.1 hypothetical protein PCANC_04780 [Puccinia coronata f. sp. avenae]
MILSSEEERNSCKPLHVRLKCPPPFIPTGYPLEEPYDNNAEEEMEGLKNGWMEEYERRRVKSRRGITEVKEYTDRWMAAWESGKIQALPQDERQPNGDSQVGSGANEEEGGGWTLVSRGGQHGRSTTTTTTTTATTISTQPKPKGADPYAQSSMADRDATAPVKVMKRNFTKTLSPSELITDNDTHQSTNKKRKGGQLNVDFYRTTNNKNRKKNMFSNFREEINRNKAKTSSSTLAN